MQKLINRLVPFILAGIAIVAFTFGIMILAYLFFIGAIVGFILFTIAWLRQRFFPSKKITTVNRSRSKQEKGRIIDSDDWKKL